MKYAAISVGFFFPKKTQKNFLSTRIKNHSYFQLTDDKTKDATFFIQS